MDTIATKAWTHPNGSTRHYLDAADWQDAIGLEVGRYRSGSIKWATLDGEDISNAEARRITSAKVWADDAEGIHVDHYDGRTDLVELLTMAVADRGLDYLD